MKKKSHIFSTVERVNALVNIFENKQRIDQIDNKYEPKFTAVEAGP